jgi:CRP-like cAMP-binding protein
MSDTTTAPERVTDPEWENFFSTKASRQEESLQKFLGRVSIFSLLRARELRTLARIVHVRDFARGEVIIPRGVQQSGLYLVRHGSVHIVRESGDGERDIVATLGPDQLLGEFALLDETPRSTSVVAAEKSELIGFFKPDLTDILSTDPAMGCMILLRLGEDMTATLNKDYKRLRDLGWPHLEGPDDAMDPTTA